MEKVRKKDAESKDHGKVWKFWCQKSPLMPGTPTLATFDAGTPSKCRRDIGNNAKGNILTDHEATYRVKVLKNLTPEHFLESLEKQKNILLLENLVGLNFVTVEDAGNWKEEKMPVIRTLFP